MTKSNELSPSIHVFSLWLEELLKEGEGTNTWMKWGFVLLILLHTYIDTSPAMNDGYRELLNRSNWMYFYVQVN